MVRRHVHVTVDEVVDFLVEDVAALQSVYADGIRGVCGWDVQRTGNAGERSVQTDETDQCDGFSPEFDETYRVAQ